MKKYKTICHKCKQFSIWKFSINHLTNCSSCNQILKQIDTIHNIIPYLLKRQLTKFDIHELL